MFLKEILFPRLCIGCSKVGKYICSSCRTHLILLSNQICIYCHKGSYMGLTHPQCARQNGIDGFITVFQYNNLLKKIIKTIKYRLAREILSELVSPMRHEIFSNLDFFLKIDGKIVFQAIPLHRRRLKERGFNQADLIIEELKKRTLFLVGDCLARIKNTPPQAQLADKRDRFTNIQGAFKIKEESASSIFGASFFLIDDVVTTGSTVKEAAQILKRNNAAKIFVFSLAKG